MQRNKYITRGFPTLFLLTLMLMVGCSNPLAGQPPTEPAVSVTTTAVSGATSATTPATNSAEPAPAAASGELTGMELNVLTFTGPQIAEPLRRHAQTFAAETGVTINVITVPFSDLYQTILTDLSTDTKSFDMFVFAPQWMSDYVSEGYLEDLSERVKADPNLQWDDIGPFFRDFSATYQGKVYTVPLDGDFQMAYYRTDLLESAGLQPPRTWDEYLNIAKTFHDKDLNGDGQPDFGSCIPKKRNAQSYWFITSVAGAYLQTQGTSQGAFFDTDTFKPLVNNAGFAKALEIYQETTKYGPPDELNADVGNTRAYFQSGRCALSFDWGDIGTLAIDKETSKVIDKTGAVILPGTTEVLDRATGKLVPCDAITCPYAVDGVNYAPFAAFGGWSGAINAGIDPQKKDAVFKFLAYVSAPAQSNVDVTIGATGFNPYRISQLEQTAQWEQAGMSKPAADVYLGAIMQSLNSPNMILDLRIPHNQRYQQVVLDQALAQLLAGDIDSAEAMKQIEAGWEEITEEIGRDEQLTAYKASLGVQR